jgi:peptidyl-prolyl cis-trans isomerase A (cyclophilin A)
MTDQRSSLAADSRHVGPTLVSIDTAYGRFIIEIFVGKAPLTARNFLRYVDEGLYKSATFYRSARPDNDDRMPKIRVIQGGIDPSCRRAPLPPIVHESTALTGLSNIDGAVSAVRWEPDTAASEFFIVLGDTPELDFGGSRSLDEQGFAVFGQVAQGMDIVRAISASRTGTISVDVPNNQSLLEPVALRIARFPNAQIDTPVPTAI